MKRQEPEHSENPKISVIVLNCNGREHLEECFTSLRLQTHPRFEIVMVDNGSTDGSVEFVRKKFPEIRVVPLDKNLGFAEGNNVGMRVAGGDYIVLLNNDTACDPNFIEELATAAHSNPRIGACAAKMNLYEARSVVNSVGGEISLNGKGWDIGFCQKDEGQFDKPREVSAACAGAMLVKREVFEKTGGFDPLYFYCQEDTDWCWRIRLLGYRIVTVPTAIVYHKRGSFVDRDPGRKRFMQEKNHIRTVLKNYAAESLFRFFPLMVQQDIRTVWCQKTSHGWKGLVRFFLLPYLWNLLHLPSTLRARRTIQRERSVPEREILGSMIPLFANGYIFDPDYPIMDLARYRREGVRRSTILMGKNDAGSLGPGWGKVYVPWKMCKAHRRVSTKAFFCLSNPTGMDRLRIQLLGTPRRDRVLVIVNGTLLWEESLGPREAKTIDCPLPQGTSRKRFIEGCLQAEYGWVPHTQKKSGDFRRFGPSVAEIALH